MKTRKSISISQAAAVDTRQVNVAVEGIDVAAVGGSFQVHLLKDGQRIASRFVLQPSVPAEPSDPGRSAQTVHVDFLLPIDAVKSGKLSVKIEPNEPSAAGAPLTPERLGNPTLRVYLMLNID